MSARKTVVPLKTLIERCYTTWQPTGVIAQCLPVVIQANCQITWPSYQTGLGRQPDYTGRYNSYLGSDQFHFKFLDDGFLQFYYAYDPTTYHLQKSKMAFFPAPSATASSEVRFDTDLRNFVPLTHAFHHLQVGAIPSLRIATEILPAPEAFFELIIRSFYPDYWAKMFPEASNILSNINLSPAQKLAELTVSDYSKFVTDLELRASGSVLENDFFRAIRIKGRS